MTMGSQELAGRGGVAHRALRIASYELRSKSSKSTILDLMPWIPNPGHMPTGLPSPVPETGNSILACG